MPFLGAGACAEVLPTGAQIAAELARVHSYPFPDRDLPRITQYIRNHPDPKHQDDSPHDLVVQRLQGKGEPDWGNDDEPHRVIAGLPINIFVTTNYDDFMLKALIRAPKKPSLVRSYWTKAMQNELNHPKFKPRGDFEIKPNDVINPDHENPVVFHMHGLWDEPASMVLTEDDYLEYLTRVTADGVIPMRVQRAFTTGSLLFLGYSLQDLDFKVLFAMIANLARPNDRRHFSVQLAPAHGKEQPSTEEVATAESQRRYLEHHYDLQGISVYWASCRTFATELRRRWNAYSQAQRA